MNNIEKNKQLIERYPFLMPRNVWTDKIDEDYDYSYIRGISELPQGWENLFLQMCEEIRQPLIDNNYLEKFRFSQIKEKYGSGRFYHNGAPEEVNKIIYKYENACGRTCGLCGAPATKISGGWIFPYCDNCAEKYPRNKFYPIDDE